MQSSRYCSTPANYFHVLRRQMRRDFRKPLVLMTPKSLLRHKLCVSTLDHMSEESTFHRVLWDDDDRRTNPKSKLVADNRIKQVVLCTGKVYYDLLEEREKRGIKDVYLMRVEQLFPLPKRVLMEELGRFPNAAIVWCQEEPRNMGAWPYMIERLDDLMREMRREQIRPRYAGRAEAAAPATGLMKKHVAQQQQLVDEALTIIPERRKAARSSAAPRKPSRAKAPTRKPSPRKKS